jgi:serine protease
MTAATGVRALVLCVSAAALASAIGPATSAQAPALPYALRLTAEQAAALRDAWNRRLPYVPGEVLVRFNPGVDAAAQARTFSVTRGGVERRHARWIGDMLWVHAGGEPDAERLAEALRRQPEVAWAQPNYVVPLKARPNDPAYTRQWNLDLIDMPRAWDINDGASSSVTIAVIDSGVTTVTDTFDFPLWTGERIDVAGIPFRVNPDIGAARVLPGLDFIFWDGPVLDMVGHGTHVAGTALQETNNNLLLAGIAHRARLMPLKTCFGYWELQIVTSALGIPGFVDPREGGGCTTSGIVQAIRHAADNGAQIVNLSLGGEQPDPAARDAIGYAVSRGVFVAISVGNEFEEGNPTEYPAAYAADIDGAMSVGAVGRSSRRAFYSNTGAHVEIVAPGGDARDGGLSGAVFQTSLAEADFDPFTIVIPRFDRYAEEPKQGTSMAAPHVAGVAALLYSQGITSPAAIEQALEQFARDLGRAGRDDEFGHGLVDARAALRGLGVAR